MSSARTVFGRKFAEAVGYSTASSDPEVQACNKRVESLIQELYALRQRLEAYRDNVLKPPSSYEVDLAGYLGEISREIGNRASDGSGVHAIEAYTAFHDTTEAKAAQVQDQMKQAFDKVLFTYLGKWEERVLKCRELHSACEESRVQRDHYRDKLAQLQQQARDTQSGGGTVSASDRERLERNRKKFGDAQRTFEERKQVFVNAADTEHAMRGAHTDTVLLRLMQMQQTRLDRLRGICDQYSVHTGKLLAEFKARGEGGFGAKQLKGVGDRVFVGAGEHPEQGRAGGGGEGGEPSAPSPAAGGDDFDDPFGDGSGAGASNGSAGGSPGRSRGKKGSKGKGKGKGKGKKAKAKAAPATDDWDDPFGDNDSGRGAGSSQGAAHGGAGAAGGLSVASLAAAASAASDAKQAAATKATATGGGDPFDPFAEEGDSGSAGSIPVGAGAVSPPSLPAAAPASGGRASRRRRGDHGARAGRTGADAGVGAGAGTGVGAGAGAGDESWAAFGDEDDGSGAADIKQVPQSSDPFGDFGTDEPSAPGSIGVTSAPDPSDPFGGLTAAPAPTPAPAPAPGLPQLGGSATGAAQPAKNPFDDMDMGFGGASEGSPAPGGLDSDPGMMGGFQSMSGAGAGAGAGSAGGLPPLGGGMPGGSAGVISATAPDSSSAAQQHQQQDDQDDDDVFAAAAFGLAAAAAVGGKKKETPAAPAPAPSQPQEDEFDPFGGF